MATKIFVDQENIAAPVLSKDHLKLSRLTKPLKVNTGKVFGGSVTGEKTVRKALGNVKQLVSQKTVPGKKRDLKVKKPASITKVSETCVQNKRDYPEIEKIFSYNPEEISSPYFLALLDEVTLDLPQW